MLEGRPVSLNTTSTDEVDDAAKEADESMDIEQPEPQVIMFSSGQMTAFTLLLEDRDLDAEWRIEADLLGRVEVEAIE